MGCWLGAFFIPLDWDRHWQVAPLALSHNRAASAHSLQIWPRTVAVGAVAGSLLPPAAMFLHFTHSAGHSAALLLLLLLLLRPASHRPGAHKGGE